MPSRAAVRRGDHVPAPLAPAPDHAGDRVRRDTRPVGEHDHRRLRRRSRLQAPRRRRGKAQGAASLDLMQRRGERRGTPSPATWPYCVRAAVTSAMVLAMKTVFAAAYLGASLIGSCTMRCTHSRPTPASTWALAAVAGDEVDAAPTPMASTPSRSATDGASRDPASACQADPDDVRVGAALIVATASRSSGAFIARNGGELVPTICAPGNRSSRFCSSRSSTSASHRTGSGAGRAGARGR